MILKKYTFFAVLLVSINCFSQSKEAAGITDVTKANFFSPGISYEKRVGKFQSLYAQASAALSGYLAFSGDSGPGTRSGLYVDPALTLQYRYYYNSARRQAKGKRTEMNSLNYAGIIFETTFSTASLSADYLTEDKRRAINLVGAAWGLQRNYKKRFSVGLNLGAGYIFAKTKAAITGQFVNKNIGKPTSLGHLTLGFWINKRRLAY
jgi:hypothetical protein